MDITWLLAIPLLFTSQPKPPTTPPANSLFVDFQGETISVVEPSDYTLPLSGVPIVDVDKLHTWLNHLDKQLSIPPVNAKMNEQGGITPEQTGTRLNRKELVEQFYCYYYENGPTQISPTVHPMLPRVDTQLLQMVRKKRIGAYMTSYNPRNKNRAHNIDLSAKAINNTVVFPGEIFSFNKVVGQRTKEKGYLPAPVIVRGELSEGIGGGICQVSSTLYNAVDRSGLKIMQRYSHSRNVRYVPPGRDATVSWYGPDFRFQNRYPYPVLIRAKSYHGQMVVTIHSFPELDVDGREVPSAAKDLPEEIPLKQSAHQSYTRYLQGVR